MFRSINGKISHYRHEVRACIREYARKFEEKHADASDEERKRVITDMMSFSGMLQYDDSHIYQKELMPYFLREWKSCAYKSGYKVS